MRGHMTENTLLSILKEKINIYKTLPYFSLIEKTKETKPVVFENGIFGNPDFSQGEIIFAIDDKKTGDIRIIGEIDDGGKNKIYHNVIISQNGEVVSEG